MAPRDELALPEACTDDVIEDLAAAGAHVNFEHLELFFVETGTTCKVCLVPAAASGEMVLQWMLNPSGPWALPKPNITISALSQSGDPFRLPDGWDTWPRHFLPLEDDDKPRGRAKKFTTQMVDLMYGINAVGAECGAWLLSKNPTNSGMNGSNVILDQGVRKYKELRNASGGKTPNLCVTGRLRVESLLAAQLGWLQSFSDRTGKEGQEGKEVDGVSGLWDALRKKAVLVSDKDPVLRRLRVPEGPKITEKRDEPKTGLRPEMTHLLVMEDPMPTYKFFTQLIPHVTVIVSGKALRSTPDYAIASAQRGNPVILLKNSGPVVNCVIRAVEAAKGIETKGYVDDEALNPSDVEKVHIPSTANLANFNIFDTLSDNADVVIEKLTRALTAVGGDELREMGFESTERDRIKYAWELVVLLEHNAAAERRQAYLITSAILLMSLLTSLAAVTLTASEAQPTHLEARLQVVSQEISLSSMWHLVLALACSILPIVSTFVLSLNSKFMPARKWSVLAAAAQRVESEIYRYRCREGEYAQRKNSALAALAAAPEDRKRGQAAGEGRAAPAALAREVFAERLTIVSDMVSAEMKMASLREPPTGSLKRSLESRLLGQGSRGLRGGARSVMRVDTASPPAPSQSPLLLEEGRGRHSDYHLLAAALADDECDDGLSLLSAEDYFTFRVLPKVQGLGRSLPILELQWSVCQVLVYLGTATTGVFAIIGLRAWVPALVSLVATVEGFAQFHQTSARLAGANGALSQLKSLRLWWQSLSMVDKRIPVNKAHLCEVCEDAIESEASAWTAGIMRRRRPQAQSEKDDEEGAKPGAK